MVPRLECVPLRQLSTSLAPAYCLGNIPRPSRSPLIPFLSHLAAFCSCLGHRACPFRVVPGREEGLQGPNFGDGDGDENGQGRQITLEGKKSILFLGRAHGPRGVLISRQPQLKLLLRFKGTSSEGSMRALVNNYIRIITSPSN
jgi:hypothetical protein